MPTTKERLNALFNETKKDMIDGDAIIAELRSILSSADNPYQREKIHEALEWAGIHFNPRRWVNYGGLEKTRANLQTAISKAISVRGKDETA
jgi:hypothetical protein